MKKFFVKYYDLSDFIVLHTEDNVYELNKGDAQSLADSLVHALIVMDKRARDRAVKFVFNDDEL